MLRLFPTFRFVILSGMLVLIAFATGWFAYDYVHAQTRSIRVSASAPRVIPSGLKVTGLRRTPENDKFVAGDRLDIFTTFEDQTAPLVLDSLVIKTSPTTISLLVDHADHRLLYHTRKLGLDLQFRRTVVPEMPDYASDYLEAQAEYKQSVGR